MSSAWGPQIRKGTFTSGNPVDATEVAVATVDAQGSTALSTWIRVQGVLNFQAIDADCTAITVTVYRGLVSDAFAVAVVTEDLPATVPQNLQLPYVAYDAVNPLAASTFYTVTVTMVGASGASNVDGSALDSTIF